MLTIGVRFRCKNRVTSVFFIRVRSNDVHLEDQRLSSRFDRQDKPIGDNWVREKYRSTDDCSWRVVKRTVFQFKDLENNII